MTIVLFIIAIIGTGIVVRRDKGSGMLGGHRGELSHARVLARCLAPVWAHYGAVSVGSGLTEDGPALFVWVEPGRHARFPSQVNGLPVHIRHVARAA